MNATAKFDVTFESLQVMQNQHTLPKPKQTHQCELVLQQLSCNSRMQKNGMGVNATGNNFVHLIVVFHFAISFEKSTFKLTPQMQLVELDNPLD